VLIVLPGVRENSSTLPKASPRSLVRDPHLGCRLRASEVGAVVRRLAGILQADNLAGYPTRVIPQSAGLRREIDSNRESLDRR
jgi:hypothetical protein